MIAKLERLHILTSQKGPTQKHLRQCCAKYQVKKFDRGESAVIRGYFGESPTLFHCVCWKHLHAWIFSKRKITYFEFLKQIYMFIVLYTLFGDNTLYQ